MEEVLAFTEGYGPIELERFVEALGKERTFTVDEARELAGRIEAPAEGGLPAYERRQELGKTFAENGLRLDDPTRNRRSSTTSRSGPRATSARTSRPSPARPGCTRSGHAASVLTKKDFDEALAKVHPTMNENLRTYYGKIQQHFKGGLPKEVQPPEYQ